MTEFFSRSDSFLTGDIRERPPRAGGKVYLIGAGPGRPDLITVRGASALQEADMLVLDYLLSEGFLQSLGIDTTGKEIIQLASGRKRLSQDEIHALLLRYAGQGKTVARLKSGDPMIFGRGNEEAEYLTAHGIPWEVVPGISVGTALSALDIPLTCRGDARSFAFVSARSEGGPFNMDFPKADTVVIFMGARALAKLREKLAADGWPPDTAVAIVQSGTHAWERRVFSTLEHVEAEALRQGIASPAIVVVGKAATRARQFQKRPSVLFTGLDAAQFRSLGNLIHWPAQQEKPRVEERAGLQAVYEKLAAGHFRSVVFTSKQGVKTLLEAVRRDGKDARLFANTRLIADGPATATELSRYALQADCIAHSQGVAGLVEAVKSTGKTNARHEILLVEGTHAPKGLVGQLAAQQIHAQRLRLIELVPHSRLGQALPAHDVIYFVSPAAVRIYWAKYGAAAFQREIWTIGPAVSREVRRLAGQAARVVENGTAALAVA